MTDPNFKPSSHEPIARQALDQILLEARTHNKWQARSVPHSLLRQLADFAKMGPTSANCSPMRVLFVESRNAKERLLPFMSEGNRPKTAAAPVTAIIAYDTEFYDKLPKLFPHNLDARNWFAGKPAVIEETAFRNSSLQGAYFIIAARALGLDTGPMSGFDGAGVNKEFFPDGKLKVNFICNLGYGDPEGILTRSPRFAFEEFCSIL
jgi:3-hydroxypropanoate dehydrogenase